jgi:hypothetical protein
VTTFWAIVLGVLSSVIASAVWLVLLRGLRPKLELSPVIVEDPATSPCFRIKLINRSRRAVVDLGFELVVMRPERTKGGTINMRKIVPVAGPPPLILLARKRGRDEGTYRLRIDADLRGILEEDELRFVRIRVFGRDAVSGIGGVAEQQYHDPGAEIIRGKYVKGPTFDVV